MNAEPNERRDADALDAFWDEVVLGPISGRPLRRADSPDEELVMELQALTPGYDAGAEQRLRQLVFGSAPEPLPASGPIRPLPPPKPAPARNGWSVRNLTSLAAAALIVVLVGTLVAAQNAGWFGLGGNGHTPTAIPAVVAQLDATPAALGSPTVQSPILWTLPFDGTNVEVGASALSDGTLYRLIRWDEFTGVQAVDTATGSEKWRSEQEWFGNGLGADQNGVYFPTRGGVRAIDAGSGEQIWDITTMVAANSLALSGPRLYVWDGRQSMLAIETTSGEVAWQGVADVDTGTTSARASQPPVASEGGIAAVSSAGTVVLFDKGGNFTGSVGNFKPETVALAATPVDAVAIAGATRQETEEPWARKLMLVSLTDGATRWETDYNALVTGLTVTDTMALVLADNGGLAMREVQLVNPDGTVTSEETNPYPEQTSPQIYGYFLDTGLTFQPPDDPSAWNAHGKTWITDAGIPPFVALAQGPEGPIAISESGRVTFFGLENPLVQAEVDLPGALPNQVSADDAAVYVSLEDGAVTAIAPKLAGLEPQPVSPTDTIDWSQPLDGTLVDFGGMSYGNGLVFRLINAGADRQIEATFAATGQPAWTLPFDWSTTQIVADTGPSQYSPNGIRSGGGNVFAVDAQNRLIALDGSAGTVSGQAAFEQPVVSMLFDSGTLYVWDESGTMTALNPADGSVLWETSSGSAGGPQSNELGMPVPVATSTIVAMVDAEGTLHGFDQTSGELLWSTPGFDGINSRLVHQGFAEDDAGEWLVVLSASGGTQKADGTFDLTVSGLLAQTGERRWDDYAQGPLVQPVATDEDKVFVVGNEAMTGKAVTPSDPIVDGESPNHYVWTGEITGDGAQRLFAIDVASGQIVWIRTTAAGGFANLSTSFPNSGALQVVTTDGQLVSPSRGNGSIDGAPTDLGGPVLSIVSSGETGAIGSFATLADGTLVAFGGLPFSQQG